MEKCEDCGRKDTLYCNICDSKNDMFVTVLEAEHIEWMCDILCGKVEDD